MTSVNAVACATERDNLPRSRIEASLELEFARDPANGATVLSASRQEPPLRVVRAFTRADASALAHLHNVSGGLLGGDRLALRAALGAGTTVQLTTTGATRAYRPRLDAAPAALSSEIRIGENALLEYVPDPIIPFAGARFEQRTEIHLAQGAALFWWEVLAPGREAHGEVFEYDRVEMSIDIVAAGRLIAAERVRLEPRRRDFSSVARLGPYRYWASFYICGVGLGARIWRALEEELREAIREKADLDATRWGISTLVADGLVVRGLARRGRDVLPGLLALWRAAKRRLWGREAILPRKVY
jgi:urease accessory protein